VDDNHIRILAITRRFRRVGHKRVYCQQTGAVYTGALNGFSGIPDTDVHAEIIVRVVGMNKDKSQGIFLR